MRRCVLRRLAPVLALVSMVCATWMVLLFVQRGTSAAAPPRTSDAQVKAEAGPDIDASRIEGSKKCIDCHRAEYARWIASKHAGRAFDFLRTSVESREYAEELGIPFAKIASNSLCLNCHATRQVTRDGRRKVLAGIGCESCHNPSGGEDGWLNMHAVYGPAGTTRERESEEHYKMRATRCRSAGQLRSSDTYQLVKRCYNCHLVGNEKLVEAGHPAANGDFFLPEKALGEVRHNFHLNQAVNAEAATLWTDPLWHGKGRTAAGRKRLLLVVGSLVDLEVALRNLALATDEDGDYFEEMADRAIDAYEFLEDDIVDEVDDGLPLVEKVLESLEDLYDAIDDEDLSLEDDRQSLVEAADQVSAAAQEFAAKHDGSKLTDLDEPEVPDDE